MEYLLREKNENRDREELTLITTAWPHLPRLNKTVILAVIKRGVNLEKGESPEKFVKAVAREPVEMLIRGACDRKEAYIIAELLAAHGLDVTALEFDAGAAGWCVRANYLSNQLDQKKLYTALREVTNGKK